MAYMASINCDEIKSLFRDESESKMKIILVAQVKKKNRLYVKIRHS